ncbi:uncharacterized protein K02A2.6-like isoform X5 [Amphibalanus amphitrite]|nr:uncharacterized protein K02A2.6-like isoform X5 [Amphibalanus amphitrite]
MLCQLHEGHFGVARMKSFGRMHFWWPGFDQDVERMAAGCRSCQRWRNAAPPTPLHPWEWPRSPWQRLHVDYCGPVNGVMLLVIIDAHSKWMDVHMTRTSSAEVTIEKLRETFACHGVPETVVTDNARYFVCPEFKTFCKRNGVRHVTSPPYSPHSNGLVERAVQTLKQGLQRQSTGSLSTRLSRFLFRYRSMPHSVTQQSPAEMLLGRPMRTQLDLLREDARRSVMEAYQRKQKAQYDVRAQPRIFQVGDKVYMYVLPPATSGPRWLPGTVRQVDGCSCWILLEDGRTFRRHFDHVRLRPVPLPDVSVPNHEYRRTMVPDEPPDSSALDSAAHAVAGESRDATVGGAEASETGALPSEKCADVGRHPSTSSPSPPSRFEAATASAPVPRRSARERRCPVRFRAGQSNPVGEECGDLM